MFDKFLYKLIDEISYRNKTGIVNLQNLDDIYILSEILTEWGLGDIKGELIQNLLEKEERTFKNPILDKEVEYKDKDGNPKSGKVGNLITQPKDTPARDAAEKALPDEGSEEREKINKELGGDEPESKPQDKKTQTDAGEDSQQPEQGSSINPNTKAGEDYTDNLPKGDPASTKGDDSKIDSDIVIQNLKSRKTSNGEDLDFETTSKGSMIIGVEHNDDKSTKETIKNIQSLPKNTKVMFLGEGGMTKDENGKFEFVGEQEEIRNATLEHFDDADESSWDENANVYDNSSPVFDYIANSLGGSKSKSNASIWSNMVSQGDDLDADDYLDDEGKDWLIEQAKKGGSKNFDGDVDWNNLTDEQIEDLYELNFRDDERLGETEISKGQESYNNYRQQELDRKIKEAEDEGYTVIAPVGNSHVDLWRQRNKVKN